MPKELHDRLARQASTLKRKGKLRDREAYIYGTMREIQRRKGRG